MNASHFFIDTITIKSASGSLNSYGEKTYGTASTIKGRVEYNTKLYRGNDGNELTSTTQFYTDTSISWDDLIWVPGESTSANGRKPMVIKQAKTGDGSYTLYEVWL